jgi:putative ATP-binding cassette transporter
MAINLRRLRATRAFAGKLWVLVKPFWISEERKPALVLLGLVVGVNLGIVYVNVLLNAWNRVFFDALQDKDFPTFRGQLLYFTVLAFAYIALAVYQLYLRQMLEIRWRRWLTRRYYHEWLSQQAYYRLETKDYGTDNPEQRIQDDIRLLVANTLGLSLGLLSAVVTLVSFLSILWTLSGSLSLRFLGLPLAIPGYMVWAAFLYAAAGSWGAHRIGRPLAVINFNQQRFEADFRFRMMRVREYAESIALSAGETDEVQGLNRSFVNIWRNWWALMRRQKSLTWFTASYGQAAIIFPFLVAAPRYFAGAIPLGGLTQTADAFGQVQGSLSWLVDVYPQFAEWKATVDRLTSFGEAIARTREEMASKEGIHVERGTVPALEVRDLVLTIPTGRVLVKGANERIEAGEAVLISGPSGSGKTTFFRALAGIWPFGRGLVRTPSTAAVLFLPQKPYLPLGTLKEAVCYPAAAASISDAATLEALDACGLGHLRARLHESANWALVLSAGEQQQMGFARALVNRPNWLFMDESTSAMDEDTERRLYTVLRDRLPGSTLVSIAHRSTVAAFHRRRLHLDPDRRAIVALPPA